MLVGKNWTTTEGKDEEHLQDRLNRDKPVASHFNSSSHSIHSVQVSVFERVHGQSKALGLISGNEWINRQNTKIASGLSKM